MLIPIDVMNLLAGSDEQEVMAAPSVETMHAAQTENRGRHLLADDSVQRLQGLLCSEGPSLPCIQTIYIDEVQPALRRFTYVRLQTVTYLCY